MPKTLRPPGAPLTTDEAAEELGVSARRVRQYLQDDCPDCGGAGCERCQYTGQRLPGAYRTGKIWLIPPTALYYFGVDQEKREAWERWQEQESSTL